MIDIPRVYKEVWLVLEVAPESQVSRIPKEILNNIKEVAGTCEEEVRLKYDMSGQVILSKDAKAIIVMLYQKFFLPQRERASFLKKLMKNGAK